VSQINRQGESGNCWPVLVGIFVMCLIIVGLTPTVGAIEQSSKTVSFDAPILSVSNSQYSGKFWVLSGNRGNKKISEIKSPSGTVGQTETVSAKATSIAQSPNGVLALGTSNGGSSAVVLYSGFNGGYVATVKVAAPVIALAVGATSQDVYVLEAGKSSETLFVFNQTYTGFSYKVDSDTVAIAPISSGADIWLLQDNGILKEMSFFPDLIVRSLNTRSRGYGLTIGNGDSLLYILEKGVKRNSTRITILQSSDLSSSGRINVPAQSTTIGEANYGSTVLDGISENTAGILAIVHLRL
jgi:hypothetical protein